MPGEVKRFHGDGLCKWKGIGAVERSRVLVPPVILCNGQCLVTLPDVDVSSVQAGIVDGQEVDLVKKVDISSL